MKRSTYHRGVKGRKYGIWNMAIDMVGTLGGLSETNQIATVLERQIEAINMAQDALRAVRDLATNENASHISISKHGIGGHMRLIDADNCPCGTCGVRRCVIPYRCADFMAWYNRTIDPESLRPRGRWVHDHYEDCTEQFEIVKCSNCGYTAYAMALFVKSGNFCPNCGAKMEDKS